MRVFRLSGPRFDMASIPLRSTDAVPLQTITDESFALAAGKASRNAAAFVTRMVAYRMGFQKSDASLAHDTVGPVSAFITSEHPSAQTVRMQTDFEAAYYNATTSVERVRRARVRRMAELSEAIGASSTEAASDLAVLATVYKQILSYVTAYLSTDQSAAGLKPAAGALGATSSLSAATQLDAAQREMQAAMESVFPRVGVKKFTSLSQDDKVSELDEIAHLVLGIRLFNWRLGKGGAGMEDTPKLAREEAHSALVEVERCLLTCNELSQQYIDTLIAIRSKAIVLPQVTGTTWPAELLNRRQLTSYLTTVSEELKMHINALNDVTTVYEEEFNDLRSLVGSKASVPKEVVYPRFHNLAARWLKAAEIRELINSAINTYKSIASYMPPTTCTLSPEVLRAARSCIAAGTVSLAVPAPPEDVIRTAIKQFEEDPADKPLKLSLEHSPEFLQLPLDFQGFCPVTLSAAVLPEAGEESNLGILVAGDPSVGVIRWRNKHVVCANAEAAAAFCAAPEYYINQVRQLALRNIELVHLLHLVAGDGFPEASLASIVQYDGDINAAAAAMQSASPTPAATELSSTGVRLSKNGRVMIDKTVETPVHFVEKHIDTRYDWNEWNMRRKALAIMNLRNCKTTSAQTDASHFRRDNDTQIYLPKETSTQTGISTATNTTRVVRYIGGLRGGPEEFVEKIAEKRGIPTHFHGKGGASTGTAVADAHVSVSTSTSATTVPDPSGKKLNMAVVTLSMDA